MSLCGATSPFSPPFFFFHKTFFFFFFLNPVLLLIPPSLPHSAFSPGGISKKLVNNGARALPAAHTQGHLWLRKSGPIFSHPSTGLHPKSGSELEKCKPRSSHCPGGVRSWKPPWFPIFNGKLVLFHANMGGVCPNCAFFPRNCLNFTEYHPGAGSLKGSGASLGLHGVRVASLAPLLLPLFRVALG